MKYKLETTLVLLKAAGIYQKRIDILVDFLPKYYRDDDPINLLDILESGGMDYFFRSWAALIPRETNKHVKRMILHDVIDSIWPIYEKETQENYILKEILTSLITDDSKVPNIVLNAIVIARLSYALDTLNVLYAAHFAITSVTAVNEFFAASNAIYAVDAAASAAACHIAQTTGHLSANEATSAIDSAYDSERLKQIEIIKKWLE